jgi:hypothetical protein
MRASIQLNPTNYIHFDTPTVADTINKTGEYKADKILVKRWGEESESDKNKKMYLLKSDEKPNKFTGIINLFFEREGYGVNEHDNGDKYFGYYKNDVRNGHGIYSFLPQKKDNDLLSEFYYGFWKTDLKSGHGIYLWLREDASKEPFSDFENSNFQAFVGEVERDIFKKGTLLCKEGDEYMVFHGTFDLDGKRDGNKCFFYSASLEEMLFGKYSEDQFVSGYVAHFDEDGNVKDFLKYEDGQITPKEKLGEEFDKNSKIMFDFRNVIMGKDYFGDVYNEFKKVKEFEKTKMTSLDIFNSDQYLNLMSVATGYNKVTIFNDIETNVEYNK